MEVTHLSATNSCLSATNSDLSATNSDLSATRTRLLPAYSTKLAFIYTLVLILEYVVRWRRLVGRAATRTYLLKNHAARQRTAKISAVRCIQLSDKKVALPTARRQAKYMWMKERHIAVTDGGHIWRGNWIEVPKLGICYSGHYDDLKQLEEEHCIKIDKPRNKRAGQTLTFLLKFAPQIYQIRQPNRNEILTDTDPLKNDTGRIGRMRKTAAVYWWLKEEATDNIFEGTVYDVPQADMSIPTAKAHFAKLEKLGLVQKLNVGKGYEIPQYKIKEVKQ